MLAPPIMLTICYRNGSIKLVECQVIFCYYNASILLGGVCMVSKVLTGLRLEESTWQKISYISKRNKRSLNSQIEYLVENYIEEYEKQNGVIPLSDIQSD